MYFDEMAHEKLSQKIMCSLIGDVKGTNLDFLRILLIFI